MSWQGIWGQVPIMPFTSYENLNNLTFVYLRFQVGMIGNSILPIARDS